MSERRRRPRRDLSGHGRFAVDVRRDWIRRIVTTSGRHGPQYRNPPHRQGSRGRLPTSSFASSAHGAVAQHRLKWVTRMARAARALMPEMAAPTAGARYDRGLGRDPRRHSPGRLGVSYANPYYRYLDDTAVVVMAMDRAAGRTAARSPGHLKTEYPRAGMGHWHAERAMGVGPPSTWTMNMTTESYPRTMAPCWTRPRPTSRRVASRCSLSSAQSAGRARRSIGRSLTRSIRRSGDGSWHGRWGMNYIDGTWSALCALNATGVGAALPEVRKAMRWLESIRKPDGGWGEGGESEQARLSGAQNPLKAPHRKPHGLCLGSRPQAR